MATWAKILATAVAVNHITVNTIITCYFDTERLSELNEKKAEQLGIPSSEVKEHMIGQVPMKRLGKPSEYGYLAAFLSSEQASYITGTNIPIDGGLLKSL